MSLFFAASILIALDFGSENCVSVRCVREISPLKRKRENWELTLNGKLVSLFSSSISRPSLLHLLRFYIVLRSAYVTKLDFESESEFANLARAKIPV